MAMRARRVRWPLPCVPRPPALRPGAASAVACSAGTRPKRMPVAAVRASANQSTGPSRRIASVRGVPRGAIASSASMPQPPSTTPAMPPIAASSRLSVSSCRTSRPRPAPSATRTATSRARAEARASSRLATLAHAINSTNATAPSSTHSPRSTFPTTSSCSVVSPMPAPAFESGCAADSCAASADAEAAVRSSVEPVFSRATTRRTTAPRDGLARFNRRGRHASAVVRMTGRKVGGITPTISCGSPPRTIDRPIAAGSAPKRRCHRECPITTTRGEFGRSSSGLNVRPAAGGAPSTSKYSCVTCSPGIDSASPDPVRLGCHP